MGSALSSFPQCRKSCVIVDMDSVAPYMVDTIKMSVFYKMEYVYIPPVRWRKLCEIKNFLTNFLNISGLMGLYKTHGYVGNRRSNSSYENV